MPNLQSNYRSTAGTLVLASADIVGRGFAYPCSYGGTFGAQDWTHVSALTWEIGPLLTGPATEKALNSSGTWGFGPAGLEAFLMLMDAGAYTFQNSGFPLQKCPQVVRPIPCAELALRVPVPVVYVLHSL